MKKVIISLIFTSILLGSLVYNSYTLECYFFTHLSDRYYEKVFNDNSHARFGYGVTFDQKMMTLDVQTLNISLKLDSLNKVQVLEGGFVTPERVDFDLELNYSLGDLSLAFGYAIYSGITKLDNEILFKANYYISPLDMILIVPEFTTYYDFRGFYGSLGSRVNVTLPTSPIVSLRFGVVGSGYTDGYYLLNRSGFGILFPLMFSIYFDKIDISLEGGYFLSLNESVQSYPYVNLRLGIEFPSE
jgi:hypothetical protein